MWKGPGDEKHLTMRTESEWTCWTVQTVTGEIDYYIVDRKRYSSRIDWPKRLIIHFFPIKSSLLDAGLNPIPLNAWLYAGGEYYEIKHRSRTPRLYIISTNAKNVFCSFSNYILCNIIQRIRQRAPGRINYNVCVCDVMIMMMMMLSYNMSCI